MEAHYSEERKLKEDERKEENEQGWWRQILQTVGWMEETTHHSRP